jgi:hypothetical protein
MKETISHLPAFNPLEDKQTLRPPLSTELTVDPPADEPQTTSHTEDALPNADESDESTGQVELQSFKTKSPVSILTVTSTQTVKGLRIPRATGHLILKL